MNIGGWDTHTNQGQINGGHGDLLNTGLGFQLSTATCSRSGTNYRRHDDRIRPHLEGNGSGGANHAH
jgi:hypothetical protein